MARRNTINRKEQMTYEEVEKDREDKEEEDDEEEDEAEASDDGDDSDDDGDDDGDDEAPKKKPKKKAAKPAAAKPKRTRAAKVVRMRAVWGVFNNANAMIAKFEFAKKEEAEAHAAKLRADKGGTYFVVQVKEPIE